jgi:hypothetical protein
VVIEPGEDGPIPFIVEQVASDLVQARPDRPANQARPDRPAKKRVDLGPHEASLRRLLVDAHECYLVALDDRETRADPDKPKRRLEDNWSSDDDDAASIYDWGEDAGKGLPDWDEWWKENYYRPRGNPGSFREAPDIPKKPLIAIYFLVNEWYRRVLGAKFWPDYSSGMEAASDDIGRLPHIGPAARLFFLVANEIDKKHTMDRCRKVHEDYYKKLPKKFVQR